MYNNDEEYSEEYQTDNITSRLVKNRHNGCRGTTLIHEVLNELSINLITQTIFYCFNRNLAASVEPNDDSGRVGPELFLSEEQ